MDQAVSDRQAEIQAKIEASKKPAVEPIDNTELVAGFRSRGGHVLHVNGGRGKKGMTVAFIPKRNRTEISTSIQHSADDFTKKVGTKLAIEHFNEGRTVFLPVGEKDIIGYLRTAQYFQ